MCQQSCWCAPQPLWRQSPDVARGTTSPVCCHRPIACTYALVHLLDHQWLPGRAQFLQQWTGFWQVKYFTVKHIEFLFISYMAWFSTNCLCRLKYWDDICNWGMTGSSVISQRGGCKSDEATRKGVRRHVRLTGGKDGRHEARMEDSRWERNLTLHLLYFDNVQFNRQRSIGYLHKLG